MIFYERGERGERSIILQLIDRLNNTTADLVGIAHSKSVFVHSLERDIYEYLGTVDIFIVKILLNLYKLLNLKLSTPLRPYSFLVVRS